MPEPANEDTEYEKQVEQELQKINAYAESLRQEFANREPDDPELSDDARKKIIELIPEAGTALAYLVTHATSESVRAGIAKFIFQEAMRNATEEDKDKALNDLLGSITKKSTA